jgi:hypothetical protein
MQTSPKTSPRTPRTRDLAEQARRAWTLFGGRARSERDSRRDDDDDDMPRPNAIATLMPLFRLAPTPLPA